jgi:hypothetical protein
MRSCESRTCLSSRPEDRISVLLGAVALILVFRTTGWRRLIRSASREAEQHA